MRNNASLLLVTMLLACAVVFLSGVTIHGWKYLPKWFRMVSLGIILTDFVILGLDIYQLVR